MKKLPILIAALSSALSFSSEAATVVWGAGADSGFIYNNATLLEAGNFARLGYFADGVTLSQVQANSSNLSFLTSNFTEIDSALVSRYDGVFDADSRGYFVDSINLDTRPTGIASALAGKQLVMWVLRATDNANVNTALASLTHHAIVWANLSGWTVPGDPASGAPLSTSLDLADIHAAGNTAAVLPAAQIGAGNYPGAVVNSPVFGSNNGFNMAPIPEPTSAFLIAVGAAGLMMRRRRQS